MTIIIIIIIYCQARCDSHSWRQYSLYGLTFQLDNGGGRSHPHPPQDCLKRWQSDHTCHHPHRFSTSEFATKSVKLVWDAQTGMCQWSTLILWVYRPGHAGVKTEQTDWQAKQPSQVARGSEDLKCLGAWWDTTCVQWHRTIDRLEERGVERGSARRSSLKGQKRALVNQMNTGTVWENFWETGWSAYGLFQSA